jgi:glycosyltransferase involved in cell wall biosynthesis
MKIRLIGIRNALGVGVHYANISNALQRVYGIGPCIEEVDSTSQQALLQAASQSQAEDINICFVSIPLQHHFRGTNIQWIVFESTRVPEIVMSTMLTADLVWVPSEWGRQTLIANGLDPTRCDVVPEGVNTELYHPWHSKAATDPLRFLLVGKFEQRKSQLETLLAWANVFGADSGAELTIKTNHFVNVEGKQQSLDNFLTSLNLTNVKPIWDTQSIDQIVELYRSHHVFVLPTKGEGWGLPLIEAAAAGMPIITTMYSGHTEFLQHIESSVVPVNFILEDIGCSEFQAFYPTADGNFGQWAVPTFDSLVSAFATARHNYVALKQHAVVNAEIIRRDFSWARSADCVVKTLHRRGLLS